MPGLPGYPPDGAAMVQEFRVEDYRGIGGLSLSGLRRMNLVAGVNGAGRTALLEALWAFHGRHTPQRLWNRQVQRAARVPLDPVAGLARSAVALAGKEDGHWSEVRIAFEGGAPLAGTGGVGHAAGGGGRETAGEPVDGSLPLHLASSRVDGRLRLQLDGRDIQGPLRPFRVAGCGTVLVPVPEAAVARPPAIIVFPMATPGLSEEIFDRFSSIVRRGRKEELRRRLRRLLPLLEDVEIVTTDDGAPYLMATTSEGERLDIRSLGAGTMRLFRIFIGFYAASPGGVLLLDEVENGLHHSVIRKLWSDIRDMAAEFEVQVFAATHSLECIEAAVAAFTDTWSDLAVIGVYRPRDEEGARAVMYADDHLRVATDNRMELR